MIKLPDFTKCVEVKQLLHMMGVTKLAELPEINFVRQRTVTHSVLVQNSEQLHFFKRLKDECIRVSYDDLSFASDGTIEIKGSKCCAYIMDQCTGMYDLKSKISGYKYHLCNCKTLQEMVRGGREKRYVVTSRADGRFPANPQGVKIKQPVLMSLTLCEHCIKILRAKGMYFEPFTLSRFYRRYQQDIPYNFQREEQVLITEKYAPDHAEVAKKYKEAIGYKCQLCQVDCSSCRHVLHLHHKNGVGTDNKRENLEVLCVMCHAEQYKHGNMNSNPKYKDDILTVRRLRMEQGLYSNIRQETQGWGNALHVMEEEKAIIVCGNCGGKMNVPKGKKIIVSCPHCENKFQCRF